MTAIGLLVVGFVLFILACLLIAARRGLWLKVEIDQPAATRPVRHLHQHVHDHEVVHHHYVNVAHHQVAHHHYLHPNPAPAQAARGGLLARAVLPRPPATPAVDPRLVQYSYDPKETQ